MGCEVSQQLQREAARNFDGKFKWNFDKKFKLKL